MSDLIDRIFLKHPRSVDEGYWQHFAFALSFAVKLFVAGFAALVHALIPCIFEKTASQAITRMHDKIAKR